MTDARVIAGTRDLVKSFGNVAAVDGVSLDIVQGEFFALLGGSGCGKTTLLRMLAGLEMPDSGDVVLDGVVATDMPPYARPTNMVFQSYALFPHMTVAGNVEFGLKQERLPAAEIKRRTAEALDLVRMTAFARRRPQQLSGGQRQRVALARAIAKKPKILLLDEPMAALDKGLREATQFELKKLQQQLGITFVIVTHDQEEAMSLATRIALMQAGRIVQIGTPSEIYSAPCNTFAASFFGSINLFRGQVVSRTEMRTAVQSAEAESMLVSARHPTAQPGEQVWLAVRPESVTVAPSAEAASGNILRGVISATAFLGTGTSYRVELAGGKEIRVLRPNGGKAASDPFQPGSVVALTFRPEDALVLKD
ncbi:MAG: ABC transporter ATP-binding protein [Parvibaculaceae bacterium]